MLDGAEGSPKAKSYRSRCEYVYSMLVMSMTDKTIKFARNAPRGDARAIWDNLTAEFQRDTRFNKIDLRRQLYNCAQNKNLSIRDLVSKIDLL